MEEKYECKECEKEFSSKEAFDMHNNSKHYVKPKMSIDKNKIKNWVILIVILIVIGGGGYWIITGSVNALSLPPTSMQGHIEASPESHILKNPMRLEVQKHMLEHVDGGSGARGGVIINYDCLNYECETELIEKLESFATKYDYVYVAPFKNMKFKIAITRLNRIETLDEYDEDIIESFMY